MRVSYQPKTGQRCSCKRGAQRDNCPSCEGTGWVIDFAAIRASIRARQPQADKTPGEIPVENPLQQNHKSND